MLLSSMDQITEDLIASIDVIVVGAGLVGLTIASDLSNSGVSVLVVESGLIEQSEQRHPLNRVEMLGDFYDGALVGRFRCLGGTSTRWGGALLPFSLAVDETNQEQSKDLWGIGHDLLHKYGQSIEKTF